MINPLVVKKGHCLLESVYYSFLHIVDSAEELHHNVCRSHAAEDQQLIIYFHDEGCRRKGAKE